MAENESPPNPALDVFLKGDAPAEAEAAPAAPVESTPAAPPTVEAKPEPEAAKPAADADDAHDAPEPEDGKIAFQAFERERARRQDWKEQAIRAQTERDELRKQLEEAKKAPPAAPPAPPQQREIPNPAVDPQAYVAWAEQERVKAEINQRLNFSEMLVRKELGPEKVAAIIEEFKEAAKANPQLTQQLYAEPHPYEWAAKQVEILRAQREIGTDPAAYRAKIIAEFQAEAKAAEAPPKVSPAAGMAPSLASARSAAPRNAAAFTGPPSLDDILAQRRN